MTRPAEREIVEAAVRGRLSIRAVAQRYGMAVSSAHKLMRRNGYEAHRVTEWRKR